MAEKSLIENNYFAVDMKVSYERSYDLLAIPVDILIKN